MSFLFAAFASGLALAQLQPWVSLPWALAGLVLTATALAGCPVLCRVARRHPRPAGWMLRCAVCLALCACGHLLGSWAALHRQAQVLPGNAPDQHVQVTAWVSDLPQARDQGQHLLLDLLLAGVPTGPPARAAVTLVTAGPHALPPLRAGDCARFTLRLRPVHALVNFTGFDGEAWSWAAGVGANGSVQAWQPCVQPLVRQSWWAAGNAALQALRDRLRQQLLDRLGAAPCRGILVALAVGDASLVTTAQWSVLWRTGVGHLVSISGVHVTLLAGLLAAVVQRGWRQSAVLGARLPAAQAGALVALMAAVFYALVAGFAIPARRTLFMLLAASALPALGCQAGAGRVFWAAVALTLLGDPFAALSPSFWMSFAAVGGLILADWGRTQPAPAWQQALQAQWVANLALLPLIALWFGQLSLVSPLANAVAVPVVSLLVMPLTLLALLPGCSALAWLPEWACEWLFDGLAWLARPAWACLVLPQPGLGACLLCGGAVLWLLLPQPLPGRGWAWCTLLPVLWPASPAPAPGHAVVEVVDVGQGLSVLVRTAGHSLLFDTGPRWPGGDTGARTLLPLLQAAGVQRLDRLMLSHPDADHVGGADSLLAALPADQVLAGYARPGATPCLRGQQWQWDGVNFAVLYPVTLPGPAAALSAAPASSVAMAPARSARASSHARNNHACVLRVSVADHAVLLPADIEQAAEQELLDLEAAAGRLRSDVVVLAHHGSRSSSGAAFVAATRAQWAIASAGWRNHFHHPAPAVVARWQAAGATVLQTDQAGGVRIGLDASGVALSTARAARSAWWRQALP